MEECPAERAKRLAVIGPGESGALRFDRYGGAIEPTASLRLPPIIVRVCRERPKVRRTLEVGGTAVINERVAMGQIDVGICSPPAARLGLLFEPLFTEPMALLPERHSLAHATTIRVADLARCRLLLSDPGCAYRDAVEQARLARGINLESGIALGTNQALIRAVQGDLGVTIVPTTAADPPPPGVVLRSLEDIELH